MTIEPYRTLTISERKIVRYHADQEAVVSDVLAVEESLVLKVSDKTIAVLMRTPGDDLELVRGFLFSEGVFRTGEALRPMRQINTHEVDLEIEATVLKERWAERNVISSSACGVCGASALAYIEDFAKPIRSNLSWSPQQILAVPSLLRGQQKVFQQTGGLHAAALFDKGGKLLVCREDVGRHNAVDKVVGWALSEGRLPLNQYVLGVSGRLSFEIVQKAVVASVPIIVSISAPSSLAVDLAERWRVTLAGFVRNQGFNVYSHASRIESAEALR